MGFPLLEGQVDKRDETIRQLREENTQLRQELSTAQREGRTVANGVATLRRQLQPLYSALQAIFGEMDGMGVGSEETTTTSQGGLDDRQKKVWEAWKTRLGVSAAKIIDALMTHGELNTQQLTIATGLHRSTVSTNGIYALNKAGLINKNGGKFSLKQL